MKTTIEVLLTTLVVVLFFQCHKEKDTVPVAVTDTVKIPDKNFLNALIKYGVDTNGDGIISPDEAAKVTFLIVSSRDIFDLKGIEAFVNLDSFH